MELVCSGVVILIIGLIYMLYITSLPPRKENLIVTDIKENLAIIDPSFRNLDIRESDATFTEDKSVIFMCLRDSEGKVYPMNTLIYVVIHELAHLLNKKDYGHTEEFQRIFDDLLCKAAAKNIYNPAIKHGDYYCGVDIRGITMPRCSL